MKRAMLLISVLAAVLLAAPLGAQHTTTFFDESSGKVITRQRASVEQALAQCRARGYATKRCGEVQDACAPGAPASDPLPRLCLLADGAAACELKVGALFLREDVRAGEVLTDGDADPETPPTDACPSVVAGTPWDEPCRSATTSEALRPRVDDEDIPTLDGCMELLEQHARGQLRPFVTEGRKRRFAERKAHDADLGEP